jgi:hypothetical protein
VTLFQDFADNRSQYWADQMGFDGKIKTVVDEWRVVFKKGRQDSLNLVNDGFQKCGNLSGRMEPSKKGFPAHEQCTE